jgi:hypothetical protein
MLNRIDRMFGSLGQQLTDGHLYFKHSRTSVKVASTFQKSGKRRFIWRLGLRLFGTSALTVQFTFTYVASLERKNTRH